MTSSGSTRNSGSDGLRLGLVVPTLNPGPQWRRWLECFSGQTLRPPHLLVVDSSSSDKILESAEAAGFSTHVIARDEFDCQVSDDYYRYYFLDMMKDEYYVIVN